MAWTTPYTTHRDGRAADAESITIDHEIALARPNELALLGAIEIAAARLLAGHAPESVLAESTPLDQLMSACRDGLLWVARSRDVPVGFAHLRVVESGSVHLQELDVHPDHGRRGLGRRLVTAVCSWATANDYDAVTLTTFRDVPWNMPFYASMGFERVPPARRSPAMRAIIGDEARRGLDPALRVVMRYRCR